jgi:hypothetical protein
MASFKGLTSTTFFAFLLLAKLRPSVSENNYGVYFNQSGPFPYGNDDPEATGNPSDAKPPDKWDRVDEVSFASSSIKNRSFRNSRLNKYYI